MVPELYMSLVVNGRLSACGVEKPYEFALEVYDDSFKVRMRKKSGTS